VSGDARQDEVREVAFLLEMFRDVFARVLPGARDRSLLPPFVVVFGSDRSFEPYKPTLNGKPAPVGGYVVREPQIPCMALRLDRGGESYRTIFHEYAHVLFDGPRIPLWLREGVAEYYSTTLLNHDRRRVLLGAPVAPHVARLSRDFLPLPELLSITRNAKIWNDEKGRTFYAESWAMVHYLIRGSAAHGAQIPLFVQRLAEGRDEREAFEETIGAPQAVERDLLRYIRGGMRSPDEVLLPDQVLVDIPPTRRMLPAEVEATFGRLQFQLQRDDEALAHLEAALRLEPTLAEAQTILGLLRMRQGRPGDAIGPFKAVLAGSPPNLLVAHNYAVVILDTYDPGRPAQVEAAYAALAPLIGPDAAAEPMAVLGALASRLGRLDEAERLLRRALERSPARRPTLLELADVYMKLGRLDEARRLREEAGPDR
jgi:tetratricopeptide (TPR) repeat protein